MKLPVGEHGKVLISRHSLDIHQFSDSLSDKKSSNSLTNRGYTVPGVASGEDSRAVRTARICSQQAFSAVAGTALLKARARPFFFSRATTHASLG